MWVSVIVFLLGALTVVGAEALGAVILIRWLNRKLAREVERSKIVRELSSPGNIDPSSRRKQAGHFPCSFLFDSLTLWDVFFAKFSAI
nr:uncharacterized protein LOC109167016 [Ipomoea trifida]